MPRVLEPELEKPERKAQNEPNLEFPKREPARRSRVKMVLLSAVVVAAMAGTWAYFHYQNRVSTDDANVEGHVTSIAPKVGGNVLEVLVNDNQSVKAGQVLVQIDPRDYQARVDQAKAAVMQAESQLQSARVAVPWTSEINQSGNSQAAAGIQDAQAQQERAQIAYQQAIHDVQYAESNVRTAQAQAERAQADLRRMTPLVEKAEISRQAYDSYVAAARVADSELQATRDRLASAQQETGIRRAAIDSAKAKLNQARAQEQTSNANRLQVPIRTADVGIANASLAAARARVEAAELDLSYTKITAPVDGVVTRKTVEPGQIVASGQNLMALIPLHNTWVTANFKETQLAKVHPGQRAEIYIDMYGRSLSGKVDSISGATGSRLSMLPAENATGNFVKVVQRIPVKILVDQTDGLVLRPGMNADVTIFTQ